MTQVCENSQSLRAFSEPEMLRNSVRLAYLRSWWSLSSTAFHVSIACALDPSVDLPERGLGLRRISGCRPFRTQLSWTPRVTEFAGSLDAVSGLYYTLPFLVFPDGLRLRAYEKKKKKT